MMRTITIEIDGEGGLDVVEDGKRCGGLAWDEMLGQVAAMTHHTIGVGHYPMRTAEEWATVRAAHDTLREHDPSAKP